MENLNSLELEFLFRIGFDLFVPREEYDWYAGHLLEQDSVRHSCTMEIDHAVPTGCASAEPGIPVPGPSSPASPTSEGDNGPREAEEAASMDVEDGEGGGGGGPAHKALEAMAKARSFCDVAAAASRAGFPPSAAARAPSPAQGRVGGAAA